MKEKTELYDKNKEQFTVCWTTVLFKKYESSIIDTRFDIHHQGDLLSAMPISRKFWTKYEQLWFE